MLLTLLLIWAILVVAVCAICAAGGQADERSEKWHDHMHYHIDDSENPPKGPERDVA
jgi:hypothetical protein